MSVNAAMRRPIARVIPASFPDCRDAWSLSYTPCRTRGPKRAVRGDAMVTGYCTYIRVTHTAADPLSLPLSRAAKDPV